MSAISTAASIGLNNVDHSIRLTGWNLDSVKMLQIQSMLQFGLLFLLRAPIHRKGSKKLDECSIRNGNDFTDIIDGVKAVVEDIDASVKDIDASVKGTDNLVVVDLAVQVKRRLANPLRRGDVNLSTWWRKIVLIDHSVVVVTESSDYL